jgi:hypothetical protein
LDDACEAGLHLEVAVEAIGACGEEGDEGISGEGEGAGVEAAGVVGEIGLDVVGEGGGLVPRVIWDGGEGITIVIVPGFEGGGEDGASGEEDGFIAGPGIEDAEAKRGSVRERKEEGFRWGSTGGEFSASEEAVTSLGVEDLAGAEIEVAGDDHAGGWVSKTRLRRE